MSERGIDDVVADLDRIVARARDDRSRLGYFPALYRKVTLAVRDGIHAGRFDDGPRMERLDVIFADRYLAAYGAYRDGGSPTRAWQVAFDATRQWPPIVLQHLLLGINAHINLDLGIAAARTVPPERLGDLRGDFDRINAILASLVGDVQQELARIWPVLRWFNRRLGTVETDIINFSMEKARDAAWAVAEQMSPLSPAEQDVAIGELDGRVAGLARVIRHPGILLSGVTQLVRIGELGSIPRKIDILS